MLLFGVPFPSGGVSPGIDLLADARLIANWNNVSELDDQSVLNAPYSVSGSPAYGDGSVLLDGTSYWESGDSFAEYPFCNAGTSFTIEFFAVRPSADDSVVLSTGTESTTSRGFIVRLNIDGTIQFHIFKTVSGQPITGDYFDAGTIPAGAGPHGGLHHIVIEGYHLAREAKNVALIRIGVNGVRSTVVQRSHFANTGVLTSHGVTDHSLRVGRGDAQYFDGTLGRIRFSVGLTYDLWKNKTYAVPSGDYETTEDGSFKPFAARPSIAYTPDAPVSYRSFPNVVRLGSDRDLGLIYFGGSSHNNADGELYWQTSSDFGRTWSVPVAITSSPTGFCSTNPRSTRLASGRIVITYEESEGPTGARNAKWKYSDDNGATWSAKGDLKAAFSATMQAIGVGPTSLSGMVETSGGPAIVGHANPTNPLTSSARLEILYYNEAANSWGSPILIAAPALALNESVIVRCNDSDKLVVISRNENDSNTYWAYKSADGGATWSSAGSAAYQRDSDHRSPPEAIEDGSGNVIMLMTHRGPRWPREIDYTVTAAADFFSDPLRAWNGAEPKTTIHRMNKICGTAEIGYARLLRLDAGFIAAWYEGIGASASSAQVYTMGLSAMPAIGKTWFNQMILVSGASPDGGTNFRDESLYARELTAYGNVQNDTGITLQGANSILFDGAGDYLASPNDDDLLLRNTDFVIQGFARVGGGANTGRFIAAVWNSSGNNRCWHLGLEATNKLGFSWSTNGSGAAGSIGSTSTFAVGTSFHFKIVRRGTTLRMFINGVQEAIATGVATKLHASAERLIIGATNGGTNSWWNGSLAEIEIANYASPADELAFSVPTIPSDRF